VKDEEENRDDEITRRWLAMVRATRAHSWRSSPTGRNQAKAMEGYA
jgi:hypothetical protein